MEPHNTGICWICKFMLHDVIIMLFYTPDFKNRVDAQTHEQVSPSPKLRDETVICMIFNWDKF